MSLCDKYCTLAVTQAESKDLDRKLLVAKVNHRVRAQPSLLQSHVRFKFRSTQSNPQVFLIHYVD